MRPWHEESSAGQDVTDEFDNEMIEAGLDPQNDDDRRAFTDQVNSEASDAGVPDSQVEFVNGETGETYPPTGNWLIDGPIGRHLFKD